MADIIDDFLMKKYTWDFRQPYWSERFSDHSYSHYIEYGAENENYFLNRSEFVGDII